MLFPHGHLAFGTRCPLKSVTWMKTTWKSLPLVVSKGPGPPWTSEDHVDHPVTKGRGMKVTQLVEERAFGSIESEVEGVKPHLCLES